MAYNLILRVVTKMLIQLSPIEIRFMHDCINDKFRNGNSVNLTIQNIIAGKMQVEQLPTIRVVNIYSSYYAFDNRRLYVYRVLHYYGRLSKIVVKLAPATQFQPRKFTTKNNGNSVVLRRGKTFQHSKCDDDYCSSSRFTT